MSTDIAKVTIGGISVVPYIVTLTLFLLPLYIHQKKSIFGAVWKDIIIWMASVIVYFGISVGLMYIPWPIQ